MLSDIRIRNVSYDAWHVASEFAAFRHIHDRILLDHRSKETLRAVLMRMLSGENSYCEAVFEKDQYFCLPRFCGSESEIYVDAGAFVGDSVERFVWAHNGSFSRIFAFEPGPRQFAGLQARTRRLSEEWALSAGSIELINAGLGDTNRSVIAATDNGQMTNFTIRNDAPANGMGIDLVSLDSFFAGDRITFLKADVEGMEMALLKGARATIQRHKPKMSICVYHYPTDIPDVTNYLADLVPDYRFRVTPSFASVNGNRSLLLGRLTL